MGLTQAHKAHIYEIQRAAGLCVDVFARAKAVLMAENALALTEQITQKDIDEAGLEVKLDDLREALGVMEAKQKDLYELLHACVKIRSSEVSRL